MTPALRKAMIEEARLFFESIVRENQSVFRFVNSDYTFGHDEIAQRVVDRDAGGTIISDVTHVFGHDGHGSVRLLYDLAGTAATIAQAFTFNAYGQMLALHNVAVQSIAVTDRLSSLGYSGEHFDAKAQQQYLRARFYNPANGRFNRLNPFAGNMQDPQSLHKYTYVHGDPIQGLDRTGKSLSGGQLAAIGIGINIVSLIGNAAGNRVQLPLPARMIKRGHQQDGRC